MRPTFRFTFCILAVLVASAQTYPDQGGAQIQRPFRSDVAGAVCFTGTGPLAGNAFFNFPTQGNKALSFTIGPSALRQDKNDTFTGPGTYLNIGIFIKPKYGNSLFGYGRVVVNDDGQSGTFNFRTAPRTQDDDDADYLNYGAAGAWDCGRKLTY
jgi:hypothetical protein